MEISNSEINQLVNSEGHQFLLGEDYSLAKTTSYKQKDKLTQLPVFIFNHLSSEKQLIIAQKLVHNAKIKKHRVIYEAGYGDSLSPLDTTLSEPDGVVLGFDPNGSFPEIIKSGTENLNFPVKTKSLLALFSLNIKDLIKNNFPKADRFQCISPYPTMVRDMINLGTRLSDKVIILPNPNSVDPQEFQKIVNDLPSTYSGELLTLDQAELIQEIGTSRSRYIFPTDQEKTPVIKVQANEESSKP